MTGESSALRYRSVVLDVDSTLCGIEGVDWLAKARGAEIARNVTEMTEEAMRGDAKLDDLYGRRLSIVRPGSNEVHALGQAYVENVAPGAVEAIAEWRARGVELVLISGGIRQAILRIAEHIGVAEDRVHAVDVYFDSAGFYSHFDNKSPLTTDTGKRHIVSGLDLPRPLLAVGDGNTDLAMQGTANSFAAFVGFISRPKVVSEADFVVASFNDLTRIVLGAD